MTNKKTKVLRRLNTLVKKYRKQFCSEASIQIVFVDSYYADKDAYATCELLDEEHYKITVALRQPVDLILDCFAHELGHVAMMDNEEIVADYIAGKLGRYK